MSAHDRSDLRDQAAAYALGALEPADHAAFEAAMAQDPSLRLEVEEFREVQAVLAGAGTSPGGPPALRGRVMARIAAEKSAAIAAPSPATTARRPGWTPMLAAAAILALVAAGFAFRDARLARTELAETRAQIDDLRATLSERESTLATLLDAERELTVVQLVAAGPESPGMQLFWNRRTNTGVLHAFRLPPAPAGRIYQLWLIKDGVPVPSQLFNPGADGSVVLGGITLPAVEGVTAAAVTEEPAGGSPQPTTSILLIGTLPSL